MDHASGPCRRANLALGRGLVIYQGGNNGEVVFVNRFWPKTFAFPPRTDAVSGIDNM